jgi:uncharacterized SAM-binding protein YcdF (DUF218 family)
MGRRRWALLLLALVAVTVVALLRGAGAWLVVADPLPARGDAIVMLAGAPAARLLETAALYQRGVAPHVAVTRERRSAATITAIRRGVTLPEPHDEATRQLRVLGVPANAITVLRGRAYSTLSEARLIARWACRTGRHSLVVVTSPSHTRRARLILRRALAPDVVLAVRPAPADFFPRRRWWRHRQTAKLVLSEYQKLVNYWLRERWRLRPCGR